MEGADGNERRDNGGPRDCIGEWRHKTKSDSIEIMHEIKIKIKALI